MTDENGIQWDDEPQLAVDGGIQWDNPANDDSGIEWDTPQSIADAQAEWRQQTGNFDASVPVPQTLAGPAVEPLRRNGIGHLLENASIAAGKTATAGLQDTSADVNLVGAGAARLVGADQQTQDEFFRRAQENSEGAARNRAGAYDLSTAGAVTGELLGLAPLLAGGAAALPERAAATGGRLLKTAEAGRHALPVAAAIGQQQASSQALDVLNRGGDAETAEKVYGTGLALNTAGNVLPASMGGRLAKRAVTGAVAGAGASAATQEGLHLAAPEYFEGPTLESTAIGSAAGVAYGAALGPRGTRAEARTNRVSPEARGPSATRPGPVPESPDVGTMRPVKAGSLEDAVDQRIGELSAKQKPTLFEIEELDLLRNGDPQTHARLLGMDPDTVAQATRPAEAAHHDAPETGDITAPTESKTDNPVIEIPLDQLVLSQDVPQFKSGADGSGVVEPLGGKFDRRGAGPIQVWRRNDGRLEIISGRHRFDLAQRSGEDTIPAQVYDEAKGFDATQAATLDAELNIRDGQGKVKDYVQYFQHAPGLDKAEAESRGLLARATGRRAHTIASEGTPELIAAHSADQLTDAAAVGIASAAPNDARLQALGMKMVQDDKPITLAANTMRAVKAMGPEAKPQSGDMFGFDESAIRDAEAMARVASTKQRELSERIAAVSGASKRPDKARALGVDVKDPGAVQRAVRQLRAERSEWENWPSNPRLMAEVRNGLVSKSTPATATESTRAQSENPRQTPDTARDDESSFASLKREPSGSALSREDVHKVATRILGVDAVKNRVVIAAWDDLPAEVKQSARDQGATPGEIRAVNWRGKTYLIDGALHSPAAVQAAIFHEHYVHFGLRAKYGDQLGARLGGLLHKVGGIDGVRKLAAKQGIDLSDYEKGVLGNKAIPERHQRVILMEELMAHMGETTGTLRRTIEEYVGLVRDFLRRKGFAELADHGVTDLAAELRAARKAAQNADHATTEGAPMFQRGTARIGPQRERSADLVTKPAELAGVDDAGTSSPETIERARRAWEQEGTRSPFFRRWFGASEVVDGTGQPARMYHGTGEDFSVFDSGKANTATAHSTSPLGHFFTGDKRLAQGYAENASKGRPADERVIDAYLKIEKPFRLALEQAQSIESPAEARALRSWLESQGYDGIHIPESGTWIAFDSSQIKSASGNRGTFDASNRDIRFRRETGAGRDHDDTPSPEFGKVAEYWKHAIGGPAFRAITKGTKKLIANDFLKRHGLNLAEDMPAEAKKAWRQYRQDLGKMQRTVAGIGKEAEKLSPDERVLVSDFIEREMKAGVTPPAKVERTATLMTSILRKQSEDLVRLGLLSEEARTRWEGRYLPRFYARHLLTAPFSRELRKMFLHGMKGGHLKGRGLFEKVAVEDVPAYERMGWELRDPSGKQINIKGMGKGQTVRMWRDFTPAEREKMGEVRDAMFRFARGYTETQADIAKGRLFESIARTIARDDNPGGAWAQVPDTSIPGTGIKRFGKLAGKWVPGDVLSELSAKAGPNSELTRAYLKGLSFWKEGKTSMNPVTHVNNVVSNLVMADLAGVNLLDPRSMKLYAEAFTDYRNKGPAFQEAQAAGLFGGEWYGNEVGQYMPTPAVAKTAKTAESLAARFANKVVSGAQKGRHWMGHMYQAEDQLFKLLLYKQGRQRGLSENDAATWAERWVFDYSTLAPGARKIKNTAIPFFSYTSKAVPALTFAATHYPWRVAKWVGLLAAFNAYSFMKVYGADSEEMKESEGELLPEYLRGRSSFFGVPKAIRLPENDSSTGAARYVDISRFVPLGDLFDTDNQMGGAPLPAPIMPNNPILTVALGMLGNKDSFTGKDIVRESDTGMEAAGKRLGWLYRQMAPNNPLIPGTWNFNRLANATAAATGETIGPYTGLDYNGATISPGRAVAQTFGVKLRTVDLDREKQWRMKHIDWELRDLTAQANQLRRNQSISDATREKELDAIANKQERLRDQMAEVANLPLP